MMDSLDNLTDILVHLAIDFLGIAAFLLSVGLICILIFAAYLLIMAAIDYFKDKYRHQEW